MKILLVHPYTSAKTIGGEDMRIFEPLALEYIAAGVIGEHEVSIIDMRFDKNLESTVNDFKPDIVGITSYTVNVNTVKELFKTVKRISPRIFTVVGGHHATICPDDFFVPEIDLIVLGEGVFVFKEVVSRVKNKQDFEGISGIAYTKDSKKIIIPPEYEPELDSLPFPARNVTKKDRENYYSEWLKPLASIRTSKGCPFRCNFCALWKITGGKYFKRDPKKIIEELSEIEEKYVFFSDDESLVDVKRMKELAKLIKQSGIKKQYFLYARSDTIAQNPELIKMWKKVGLIRVFVGLEFFRDEDLEYVNKKLNVKNNIDAIKILKDNNVDIYASFIVRPDFTKKDFADYKKFCRKLRISSMGFTVLTPLPGTDFYEEVKDKIIEKDYDILDLFHPVIPTKLKLEEFFEEFANLYMKSKSSFRVISVLMKYPFKEIPPVIKRSKAFFKHLKNAHKDYD